MYIINLMFGYKKKWDWGQCLNPHWAHAHYHTSSQKQCVGKPHQNLKGPRWSCLAWLYFPVLTCIYLHMLSCICVLIILLQHNSDLLSWTIIQLPYSVTHWKIALCSASRCIIHKRIQRYTIQSKWRPHIVSGRPLDKKILDVSR